ncbi:hypothetical protein H072_7275 [Dactylellina haptotyla CBS 200.50]|uniref:ribonuclease III n=1 Tax=Dactylellina haptotyla (strain CBS 200.50) TaxID=1284197 RepID=S8BUJ8_DACHA|nr:hypothetical protein H072_7275 [Dactylellina haptotyla CBS 200.50]
MTHADRERKRKHSEASTTSTLPHHHHPYHPVPPRVPNPPSQAIHDPRYLYNGYVEYTTGDSPVQPAPHHHRSRHHPKPPRHPATNRRPHTHNEVPPPPYYQAPDYYYEGSEVDSRAQVSHFHPDQPESLDRPGKRHRSHRERALQEDDNEASEGELSDTGADVGEVSFDDSADRISAKFNSFNTSLAGLLSVVDSDPDASFPLLDRILGRERSSFVKTMKAMQLEGSLPWLVQARTASPDLSVAPSKVIKTTNGLLLEPINPRQLRSGSHEPSSRKVSTTASVRSISTSSSVPPVPFSTHTADPSVKRAKIWPPELPPIKNEEIRKQVFSHKSVVDGASSMIGEAGLHNERIEFLGDSYLGAIVTRYIFSQFPTFREGAMTNIRSSIVGNKNLHDWCLMYKLDKQLITGEGKHAELIARSKTLADLFEAYVGGLLLDSGPEIVDEWVKDLIEPRMKEVAEEYNREKPLNKAAKNDIASMIGGKNATIEYRWTEGLGGNQGGYHFTIFFTGWGFSGKVLGQGWGANKTDASIRAAMNALEEGNALREVKRAKQRWYEENQPPSSAGSETGTVIRHDIP